MGPSLKALGSVAILGAVLAFAGDARAARYDLNLGKLCTVTGSDTVTCDQTQIKSLLSDLGTLTAPLFLTPAETLGLNGFEFAITGSVVPLKSSQSYWDVPTEGDPSSILFVPRIHVRKGLPFSFEIGTDVLYIPDSELFGLGAEVRWALNEGFYFVPDLAIRVAIEHLIGAKDFELSSGGWDITLSKTFGVGGMLSLAPYAGYNMLFVHATAHVVLAEKMDAGILSLVPGVFQTISWKDNLIHRGFFGLKLKTAIFEVVAEGVLASNSQNLFSFKLGFDF